MNKSLFRFIASIFAAFSLLLHSYAAMADDNKEGLVKAAFIYNFVKFIEWPGDKATSKLPAIDICTLGSGGINGTEKVFQAASTDKLKLSLVVEKDWKSVASHCHIVFISSSEAPNLGQILNGLKSSPVLTVSDMPTFAEQGGMIGFVASDNKIKIAVNTKSITAASLRVDAQLLEIALKVIDK